MGYFNEVKEEVSHSDSQFDSSRKECMLSTTLGFLGDMSHRSVLALEVPGFPQGLLPP